MENNFLNYILVFKQDLCSKCVFSSSVNKRLIFQRLKFSRVEDKTQETRSHFSLDEGTKNLFWGTEIRKVYSENKGRDWSKSGLKMSHYDIHDIIS